MKELYKKNEWHYIHAGVGRPPYIFFLLHTKWKALLMHVDFPLPRSSCAFPRSGDILVSPSRDIESFFQVCMNQRSRRRSSIGYDIGGCYDHGSYGVPEK
jgi:hypothetical protein